MRLLLLNGPNLNLLGTRAPDVYGTTTLVELEAMCGAWAARFGIEIVARQSNHEGALIDILHESRSTCDGVVFNPGALTHTSYALHDAVEAIDLPTVEVHISNVEEREAWRRVSVIRPACIRTIYGRGVAGYRWAIEHLYHRGMWPPETVSYGEHVDQVFELRLPDVVHQRMPAVLLVHGGFWRHMWTRETLDAHAIDLARRGFVTANVEYRRAGLDPGIGPADMVADVVSAVRAVRSLPEVDANRMALIGHSAGAHLAVLAAVETRPLATISMGGVLDLELAIATEIGSRAAEEFLGASPPESWSPVRAARDLPGLVLVHGEADDHVPIDHAQRMKRHSSQPVRTVIDPAAGHFDILDIAHPHWQATVDAIMDVMESD